MNKIVVEVELCAEDRARVDRLIAALEAAGSSAAPVDPLQQKLAETLAKVDAAPLVELPADQDLPWDDAAPSPDPAPVREVSLAEFQKALTLRCSESEATKAKVRGLLHEYAEAASKVPPEKRAEVLDRLAKL